MSARRARLVRRFEARRDARATLASIDLRKSVGRQAPLDPQVRRTALRILRRAGGAL